MPATLKRTGGSSGTPVTIPVHLSALAIEQLVELAAWSLELYVQDGEHRDHLERAHRALLEQHYRNQLVATRRDIAAFEGYPTS